MALKAADSQVAQAEATYAGGRAEPRSCGSRRPTSTCCPAQDNLEAKQASLEAIARQLDQADKRFDVGLIAITDVQEAKAARDTAAAAVIAAKRTLATSEDQLQEITGQKYDALAKPGDDMPLNIAAACRRGDSGSTSPWIRTLTLLSSRLAADIARDNVQDRLRRPPADAGPDRGKSRTLTRRGSNRYSASQAVRHYDSGVNDRQITLQITRADLQRRLRRNRRVRQSQYLWIAAKEQVVQTSRATERQARDAYLGVISGIARVQALRQALESSQTALKATEAGYEVGTRTAVDVLNARAYSGAGADGLSPAAATTTS